MRTAAPPALAWLAAIVLLGLNFRTIFASLPPLLTPVRDDLGLSASVAGLLTTVPVICFGAFAPVARWGAARMSIERMLAGLAALTAAGAGLRGIGGVGALFLGTLLAGAGVAVSQVLLPVLVRSRFSTQTGLFTGAFSMSLPLGASLGAVLAVPLEDALDGWEGSLAAWALPATLATLIWIWAGLGPGTTAMGPPRSPLRRAPLAWWVALFFGLQSATFYAGLTWLPTILEDDGYTRGEAGALQALCAATQILPAFLVPVLASRRRRQTRIMAAIVGASIAGTAGLLFAPDAAVAWVVLLGIGQGGALGIALILPVLRGGDRATVAALTAMTLGVGYLIASTGPWLLGVVHDLSGSWDVPLATLLVLTVAQLVPGWLGGRDLLVGWADRD